MRAETIREAAQFASVTDSEQDKLRQAALAYANLLEESQHIWWCEEHGDTGSGEGCPWHWVDDDPCLMTRMALVPVDGK